MEITGPHRAKMAINALNSGAKVWLADLEDASTPHLVQRHRRPAEPPRRRPRHAWPSRRPRARSTRCGTDAPLAVVVARPRGWHLDERHLLIDGEPAVGALVDFGLHFFHNAARSCSTAAAARTYYLPKMESHLEARLWNDVFIFAQDDLGIPHGTIRATVLIETIPAAFEMDEILYELRDHASGLNAGRWDYLFSVIKYFRDAGPGFVLPDRAAVTMTAPLMRAYTELLVKTCHHRGAFAMGGMAAFIPSRREPEVNRAGVREGPRGQGPGGRRRLRRLLGGPPGPGAGLPGGVRRRAGRPAEPAGPAAATTSGHRATSCWTSPRCRARSPRPACAATSTWPSRYLAVWLGGNGAVGHPQPDGGRGHGGDLPLPGLAVGAQRRPAGHRRTVTAELVRRVADEELAEIAAARSASEAYADEPVRAGARACSSRSRWPTTSPTSSPCPRTRRSRPATEAGAPATPGPRVSEGSCPRPSWYRKVMATPAFVRGGSMTLQPSPNVYPAPDRNLALELVRVTEAAAMAAGRWVGRGDKNGADGAAVDAMRTLIEHGVDARRGGHRRGREGRRADAVQRRGGRRRHGPGVRRRRRPDRRHDADRQGHDATRSP